MCNFLNLTITPQNEFENKTILVIELIDGIENGIQAIQLQCWNVGKY